MHRSDPSMVVMGAEIPPLSQASAFLFYCLLTSSQPVFAGGLTIEHIFSPDWCVFWLSYRPFFSLPHTVSIPCLIIFFSLCAIEGTVLYLFTFCHGCFFPFIHNLTSIRGNSLLQGHIIGLEPLSPSVVPGVTIKVHERFTLELSYWENPLPREIIEASTQDV